MRPGTNSPGHRSLRAAGRGLGRDRGAQIHNGIFHIRNSFELDDRTGGDLDLVLHSRASETGIASGDVEGCMAGQYQDGPQTFAFFGCDAIQTIS